MAKAMTKHSDAQSIPVSFTLNGRLQEIEVEPHELLLDLVREQLGLTGAKRSCDVEVCGACTLLVDGRPVSACTTLAFEVRGRSVLTIEGLAQVAGVSPRHFIRAFRESAGQTPLRFVYGLRLERAKEFLLDPRRTATEVALDCGFSHAQHFSTAFKKATGVTPSDFRRAATR